MMDCLVIGGGPAGLTAGIYLRRFHRSVCLVDSGQSRAGRIPLSHNFPGFPDGVSGNQLLHLLREQFARFGGLVTDGTVTGLRENSAGAFEARIDGQLITAKTVLLATGTVDIEPVIDGYETVRDNGLVRFCPICDGFEFSDQRIAVIGSGEHGLREAEFIRHFSANLCYVALRGEAPDPPDLARRLREGDIKLLPGNASSLHAGDPNSARVQLTLADGALHEFDMLYCALGNRVRSALATDLGAAQDDQHCLLVNAQLETSVPGLFAAGDVVSSLDQLAVATGQAAVASTAIHNRLRTLTTAGGER